MKKITVKNITVIDPKSGINRPMTVIIEDGLVRKMTEADAVNEINSQDEQVRETVYEDEVVIDGRGLIMAPGLVDVHVHFRDPGFTYKEDIHTGALAAAKGGFTSVVLMANTKPVVDNLDTLKEVMNKADREEINIYSTAAVTRGLEGQELTNIKELVCNGAVGITDDGKPILEETVIRAAMEQSAKLSIPISLHEEDPRYIENNGINSASLAAKELGITGSDRKAEISLANRDIKLALETGAILNIQHISTEEAVASVREAKKRSERIHAEATPHHFTLNEDAVLTYGTMAKMNPPLRLESDRMAIIEALKDGTIDIIATDHAPHSREEKNRKFNDAPSGIIGLETSLALAVTELVNNEEISFSKLIELMSVNPAKLYGLDAGYIKEGGPADLVIFDPKEEWVVKDYLSKSDNSPFTGWKLRGRVKYTICRGSIVYQDK